MTSPSINATGYIRESVSDYALPPARVFDFSTCKGTRKGPVFLVGSGSSAGDFPVREFANTPMITMNGAFSMFAGTKIKPLFYVCSDRDFPNQQPELFAAALRGSENVGLWEDQFQSGIPKPAGRAYALKKSPRSSTVAALCSREEALVRKLSLWSSRSRDIGFSKNLELGFFDARTVMYLALQLAHHLGFDTVFLVGFDLNQSAGRFYESSTDSCSPCGLDQHYESRILPSLELMSKHVMGDDFQVFNLSESSRVPHDIIPRMSLDEARRKISAVSNNTL
ncbi:lipopolysaccharide core biosynthesis domain protein [Pseudomonas syringae]|uniref:lipopolysaccharide biosynthesis protein n=1 Tax=Pseudomonas syringae TaxID=317 RepID=UPI001CA8EC01|nr:lipopolysaccharide biosynthesis protein [Pseudomonas syringae]MCI3945564.1 lipopolysaccharide core biosynthesis domain protein [Pseudomonas syringae]